MSVLQLLLVVLLHSTKLQNNGYYLCCLKGKYRKSSLHNPAININTRVYQRSRVVPRERQDKTTTQDMGLIDKHWLSCLTTHLLCCNCSHKDVLILPMWQWPSPVWLRTITRVCNGRSLTLRGHVH